jgi:hypothetical protein
MGVFAMVERSGFDWMQLERVVESEREERARD